MKITVINGQNHKGSTWNTAEILLSSIKCDKEVTQFFLPRDLNHFCMGCYACIEGRDKCPYWNEKKIIDDAIREADLIILTSPNYCMMPSAPMKAFFDLFFTNWGSHKPYKEMYSKKAVVISTTAGMGAGKAAKLMAQNLKHWGIPEITKYALAVNAMNWQGVPEKKKAKIKRDMAKLGKKLSEQKPARVGIGTKMRFGMYRNMQNANWGASPSEKKYWEDNGWLSKDRPWKK